MSTDEQRSFGCVTIVSALGALCLAMGTLLFLVGCDAASPEKTVEIACEAIQERDVATLKEVYAGGALVTGSEDVVGMLSASDDLAMGSSAFEALSSHQQEVVSEVTEKLCSFSYTVGEVAVDGDKATVSVTFKTYDFGSAYADVLTGFSSAFIQGVSDGSDADGELTKVLVAAMEDEVTALELKSKSSTTTLSLTKEGRVWVLDELGKSQLDAMFGGLVTAFRG